MRNKRRSKYYYNKVAQMYKNKEKKYDRNSKEKEGRKKAMAIRDKAANCVWITVIDMFCRERLK